MISPSRYTQHIKKELVSNVSSELADIVLNRFHIEPELVARIVSEAIPRSIPVRYHKRMQSILITAYLKAICKNTTYACSLQEWHDMLHKALMYTGNVRES